MNETRKRILDALGDGPVAGPSLATSLGITRAAVWKHIEELRKSGFQIESSPDGYTLISIPEYNGSAIAYGLEVPYSIEYHDALDSTNRRARELATQGQTDSVVVANTQDDGRGRLDRQWSSPSGGIYLSIVIRPSVSLQKLSLFTLAGAVAIANTAREFGVNARIKWPNDVVIPGEDGTSYRKLAGILTEMGGEVDRIEWLVIGIGVNANIAQSELPDNSTSLQIEREHIDRRIFVQRLLEQFHGFTVTPETVLPEWRKLTITLDQMVRIDTGSEELLGTAVDITDTGALVLDTESGRQTVFAGDCELLRPVDLE